jgi:alpha-L-rhamnosidase
MWDPNMNSFNHYAYGAVCAWVFGTIGGLNTDNKKVAYKHSILRPIIATEAISWAKTSYESVYGLIALSWEKKNDNINVQVTVPPNTTATLTLPGAKAGTISGVTFTEVPGGAASLLGSGSYSFTYPVG